MLLILSVLISSGISGYNYFTLSRLMNSVKESDFRNEGIEVSVYYENYINPDVIVFDLKHVNWDKSQADIFRVFWQFSAQLWKKRFNKVILAYQGKAKFYITGAHFYKLGIEYGIENPIYITRTLPENVYKLNGERAFPIWTGGMIGVLNKQMENFNELGQQWYLNDMITSN